MFKHFVKKQKHLLKKFFVVHAAIKIFYVNV